MPYSLTAEHQRRDRIAQWAFDTRTILARFHLWLEDVDVAWLRGNQERGFSFAQDQLERALVAATAVTALGTYLFGRYGEGKDQPKPVLNAVKKDADAMSSYAMSEALWFLSRNLPENHAIMVCLGEGLMPKAGETPEMGANPLLGFGRVYARPMVAKFLDKRVARLINDPTYSWDTFFDEINEAGVRVWGAAIDTLENTSRFAQGATTGPMTVIHLFDQPLRITQPYEGYIGNLFIPKAVADAAADQAVLLDFHTPRAKLLEMIQATYPGTKPEHVHVWTLRGKSRTERLGPLWNEWTELGAHIIDDGWTLPNGKEAFADSGTYAPIHACGQWTDDDGASHVLILDGYAASAEAVQAATLAPNIGLDHSMVMYTSKFKLPCHRERHIMNLDPDAADFDAELAKIFERDMDADEVDEYRQNVRDARDANFTLGKRIITADDFFPKKYWRCLALAGYMLPDPYSAIEGVEKIRDDVYRVSVRATTAAGDARVDLTFRLTESIDVLNLVFNPLLDRFCAGEDYTQRAVKISDSGRIRNELQTLASQALEFFGENGIRVHFDRIHDDLMSPEKRAKIREVLEWYKANYPVWFKWLELV